MQFSEGPCFVFFLNGKVSEDSSFFEEGVDKHSKRVNPKEDRGKGEDVDCLEEVVMKKVATIVLIIAVVCYGAYMWMGEHDLLPGTNANVQTVADLGEIPEYGGQPYVEINNNSPTFTEKDKETLGEVGYEYYSALDSLGRCGVAEACVGPETMPDSDRTSIGQVKPSGWHTVRSDRVNGKYVYNRCHLCAYMLTGENANDHNLITGTRYLNIDGMLPFEDKVGDYVKTTGHHVMYRVTPIFEGNNLLASGVHMEAQSIEDNDISFNVYCYNVQPGIEIDYATGEAWEK